MIAETGIGRCDAAINGYTDSHASRDADRRIDTFGAGDPTHGGRGATEPPL